MASYTFRDVDSLPVYSGQGFEGEAYDRRNIQPGIYPAPILWTNSAAMCRETSPAVIVLDDDMTTVYDSLMGGKYEPVKKGYLILV